MNLSNMSIEQKRELLNSASGRIFSVKFLKKDKSVREMSCMRWLKDALTYGVEDVRPNSCSHLPNIYTLADINAINPRTGKKGDYRNLDLNSLIEVVIDKKHYSL